MSFLLSVGLCGGEGLFYGADHCCFLFCDIWPFWSWIHKRSISLRFLWIASRKTLYDFWLLSQSRPRIRPQYELRSGLACTPLYAIPYSICCGDWMKCFTSTVVFISPTCHYSPATLHILDWTPSQNPLVNLVMRLGRTCTPPLTAPTARGGLRCLPSSDVSHCFQQSLPSQH